MRALPAVGGGLCDTASGSTTAGGGHRLRGQRTAPAAGPRHPGGAVHAHLESHALARGDHPSRLRAGDRPRQRAAGRQHHDPGRGGGHQDPAPEPGAVRRADRGVDGLHAAEPAAEPSQRGTADQGSRHGPHRGGSLTRRRRVREPEQAGRTVLHGLPRESADAGAGVADGRGRGARVAQGGPVAAAEADSRRRGDQAADRGRRRRRGGRGRWNPGLPGRRRLLQRGRGGDRQGLHDVAARAGARRGPLHRPDPGRAGGGELRAPEPALALRDLGREGEGDARAQPVPARLDGAEDPRRDHVCGEDRQGGADHRRRAPQGRTRAHVRTYIVADGAGTKGE